MRLKHWISGLRHRDADVRAESYDELCERVFDEDGGLRDAALGVALVPHLAVQASSRAAPRVAAFLLELAAAARRTHAAPTLAALGLIDGSTWSTAPPAVSRAVRRALAIRDGETAHDVAGIFDACDEALACDQPEPPRRSDVAAWCRGRMSVGGYSPESPPAFDLLVSSAFTEGTELEVLARGAHVVGTEAGRVLQGAHRRLFHAVLAWRTGRDPALPSTFPSHREEARALSAWVLAAEGRDAGVLAELLALSGCASVAAVRVRESSRALHADDVLAGFDSSFSRDVQSR